MRPLALAAGYFILFIPSAMAIDPVDQEAIDEATRKFQGTWKFTSLVADGHPAPAEVVRTLKLVFKDDKLTFVPGEPGFTNYVYKLDASTTPPAFDMIHADGDEKGQATKAIYTLEGDRLKICFGFGDDRPTKFSAEPESEQAIYSLERVKH